MSTFLQGLRRRRWLRVCAWIAFSLLTALVLARQYVGWSGSRRWAAVQQMLAREGESLDLRVIAPEPVPDSQNFFAIPALKDVALASGQNDGQSEAGRKLARLLKACPTHSNGNKPPLAQGAPLGRNVDLNAWAAWLRLDHSLPMPPESGDAARDVLAGLSGADGLIHDLALGLSRPESQWTPAWKTRALPEELFMISLPYYSAAQALCTTLGLRCAAAAKVGDAAGAHESLLIALRLNQAFMQEPLIISTLVGCGMSAVDTSAVWELCDAHAGTAEDFRKLQEELSRLDYKQSLLCAGRGELAFGANAIDYFKRKKDLSILDFNRPVPGYQAESFAVRLLPDGWFDGNEAALVQWRLDYWIKPLRDHGFEGLLGKQDQLESIVTAHLGRRYLYLDEVLALMAMPALKGVIPRAVYAQSLVNEAIAACALERYRIDHGTYPDTLAAANRPGEKDIPLDIISGKPIGYRKTADGRYALWCVGFEGRDHGGVRALDAKNPERTRFFDPKYRGDWVWDFPVK